MIFGFGTVPDNNSYSTDFWKFINLHNYYKFISLFRIGLTQVSQYKVNWRIYLNLR